MSPEVVLLIVVLVLIAGTTLEQVARVLQVRHQPLQPPAEIAPFIDAERYATSQRYTRERLGLGLGEALATLGLWLLLLLSGALGWGYAQIAGWLGSDHALTPLLLIAGVALLFDLVSLPFELRSTFGIEARYGFNTTTPALFVRDKLVNMALAVALGGPLLWLLFAVIERLGANFYLPFAAIVTLLMVLLVMFQTSLLLPLFNRLSPLPAGEVREAIEAYAKSRGVGLENIYQMDGSKRSRRVNAFFSGLGKRRKVVLYDTLLERHPVDEVVGVVAHEVGHDQLGHVPRLLALNVATITLTLFIASRFIDSATLSLALGASEQVVALNLIAFVLLYGPISTLIGALGNALSRRFEYQADAFAAETHTPPAIANALGRMVADDFATVTAHPLYTFLNLTHPAPVQRIRAIHALKG